MSVEVLQARLLPAILDEVPFDGWSDRCLVQAAKAIGMTEVDRVRAFPGGPIEVLAYWNRALDEAAAAAIAAAPDLKVREKVALGVRTRLEAAAPHKEAVRRGLGLLALPGHVAVGGRLLAGTLDAIWYAAGDRATDFNYYTKRGLLAGVYLATLLYWLDDESEAGAATWVFLEKRIADALRLPGLIAPLRQGMKALLTPPFLRRPAADPT